MEPSWQVNGLRVVLPISPNPAHATRERLRADRVVVAKGIARSGLVLRFASRALQGDRAIVLQAALLVGFAAAVPSHSSQGY